LGRDRVVHHALMNVLAPVLDRRFHPHSYAGRKGKGTHAAADRLQYLMRRRRYALQCDICKFFPSIDHLLLKTTCRRFFKDGRVLGLLWTSSSTIPTNRSRYGSGSPAPIYGRRGNGARNG
jgi:RNA-directed DNA polymerase